MKAARRKAGRSSRREVGLAAPRGMMRRVAAIIDGARSHVVRAVNSTMILAYWHIGREIVEEIHKGRSRAEYGERLLESLSRHLTGRYGRGYSVTNLRYFRLFYQAFSGRAPEIHHTACDESRARAPRRGIHRKPCDKSGSLALTLARDDARRGFSPLLSWSHYRALSRVENRAERLFYETEAEKESWSVPHLERQIDTLLFARLLKSRDKRGILRLAREGQVIRGPADILKDPYILDFLDLPDAERWHENAMESAIIERLRQFLLELGKGFAFIARQKRLDFEDEQFYVDLVFYNTILKCHLLVDLKIGKLTHQDIGQMDSYVRLFDDRFRSPGDNPTIGLILCARKNEAVARYSILGENRRVFAAKYLKVLPSEAVLRREIDIERRRLEADSAWQGRERRRRS